MRRVIVELAAEGGEFDASGPHHAVGEERGHVEDEEEGSHPSAGNGVGPTTSGVPTALRSAHHVV